MSEAAATISPSQGEWIEMKSRRPRCKFPYELRGYDAAQDEALVYRSYLESFWRMALRPSLYHDTGEPYVKIKERVEARGKRFLEPMPEHGRAALELDREVYNEGQRAVFNGILQHAQVRVACNPGDDWQVLGYMVFDDLPSGLVLHYVYTKKVFRSAGLGSSMVATQLGRRRRLVYTHHTRMWPRVSRSLRQRLSVASTYNPYLGR